MQTKLTLIMDKKLIEEAKVYAKETQQSLSQLVSEQLERILCKNEDPDKYKDHPMADLVGILDENSVAFKGKSHKQIMYEHVLEKHG
ncbi:MAG: hypothetical protein RLZZ91_73 [Bacteroidota bacterium]|jgi:hypothetical protein